MYIFIYLHILYADDLRIFKVYHDYIYIYSTSNIYHDYDSIITMDDMIYLLYILDSTSNPPSLGTIIGHHGTSTASAACPVFGDRSNDQEDTCSAQIVEPCCGSLYEL